MILLRIENTFVWEARFFGEKRRKIRFCVYKECDQEIQRVANLLPLNVLHRLTKDVVIDGFHLPKGTAIVPQISALLIDDEVFINSKKFGFILITFSENSQIFEKPDEFRPERFIDENGKLKKIDALIPFSIGKRYEI